MKFQTSLRIDDFQVSLWIKCIEIEAKPGKRALPSFDNTPILLKINFCFKLQLHHIAQLPTTDELQ